MLRPTPPLQKAEFVLENLLKYICLDQVTWNVFLALIKFLKWRSVANTFKKQDMYYVSNKR